MRTEIERKFLVHGDDWKSGAIAKSIRQGYIRADKNVSVRVRKTGENAFLTIKGRQVGSTRAEYEYGIPVDDADDMLDTLCEPPLIEKIRYTLEYDDVTWEVDVFKGENSGLVVAEVELESENQIVELPDWVGPEVTRDPRYLNANLAKTPYSQWSFAAASDS